MQQHTGQQLLKDYDDEQVANALAGVMNWQDSMNRVVSMFETVGEPEAAKRLVSILIVVDRVIEAGLNEPLEATTTTDTTAGGPNGRFLQVVSSTREDN